MEKLSSEPPNLKKPRFWKSRRTKDVCTHKTQLSTLLHFKNSTKAKIGPTNFSIKEFFNYAKQTLKKNL
jgi:hypothetical protein